MTPIVAQSEEFIDKIGVAKDQVQVCDFLVDCKNQLSLTLGSMFEMRCDCCICSHEGEISDRSDRCQVGAAAAAFQFCEALKVHLAMKSAARGDGCLFFSHASPHFCVDCWQHNIDAGLWNTIWHDIKNRSISTHSWLLIFATSSSSECVRVCVTWTAEERPSRCF